LTVLKIDTPRFVTMLSKSFLASTSNYNEYTNVKPSTQMPNEKVQREFQCIIKTNGQGTWNKNIALWSHFSKMTFDNSTLGDFRTSLRTRGWFHCLSQETFCSLFTYEDTNNYNFSIIIFGLGFML
jgi:hypothetical protein